MIVYPLAFCQTCGVVFEACEIALSNVQRAVLKGNKVRCPNGHIGQTLDGTFSAIDGALRVIEGDSFTREQVSKLSRLRDQARQFAKHDPHEAVPDEFIQALDEVVPGTAGAWSLLKKKQYGWAAFVFFIGALISRCGSDAPIVDLSTHNETHYHVEQPLDLGQPSEREEGKDPFSPDDGSKTEDDEDERAAKIKFAQVATFRRALLRSTVLGRKS